MKNDNNAGANDERRLAETLWTLARRYHDTLTDLHQHDRRESVVRLAIDLARMAGNQPEAHLARAARLLTEAGSALAEERERPEREGNAEITSGLNQIAADEKVPPEIIYLPGKSEGGTGAEPVIHKIVDGDDSFQWKTFTSEKGFQELLVKHFRKVCDEALLALNELLFTEPPQLERARKFFSTGEYFFDGECSERLARVATAKDANEFFSFWRARCLMMLPKRIIDEAKAGRMSFATLRALSITRGKSYADRSQSAAVAKKAKARMHHREARPSGKK